MNTFIAFAFLALCLAGLFFTAPLAYKELQALFHPDPGPRTCHGCDMDLDGEMYLVTESGAAFCFTCYQAGRLDTGNVLASWIEAYPPARESSERP